MDLLTDPDTAVENNEIQNKAESEIDGLKNMVWEEKYRPRTLDEIILPDPLRDSIKYAMENDTFQNMIFHSGKPGTGKTTVSRVIPEEYGCDYMFIKTAAEGRLDTVENVIPTYGMQKIGGDKPRFVILDEADRVRTQNIEAFYTALQPIIENTRSTLRFILTVNHLHRIPEPIRSRCKPISFAHNDKSIKRPMWNRIKQIAQAEIEASGGTLDESTLKQMAQTYFPDMRAIISAMQNNFNCNKGSIQGSIENIETDHITKVWELINKGDVVTVRQYFTEHVSDISGFYHPFLDFLIKNCKKEELLSMGVIIAEHQALDAYDAVDPEVNSFGMFCKMVTLLNG